MMYRIVVVFMLFTILVVDFAASITLRVRLTSGSIVRVDVDGDKKEDGNATTTDTTTTTAKVIGISLSSLRSMLSSSGYLTETSKIVINDVSYHMNSTDVTVDAIHGQMIDIHETVIKEAVSSTNSMNTTAANSIKRVSLKSETKKRVMSVSDINKRRKEMMKINRQKTNATRVVEVSSISTRILKRLADDGGVCVLLGRVVMKSPSPAGKGGSRKTNDKLIEHLQIDAVCEINCNSNTIDSNTFKPSKSLNDASIKRISYIVAIANALGLQVLGCGVSLGSKCSEKSLWTKEHLYTSLQLKQCASNNTQFITLSISSSLPPKTKKELDSEKYMRNKRKTPEDAMISGLCLEVFQLSDQALQLYNRNVLLHEDAPSATRTTTASTVRPKGDKDMNKDLVILNGNILVQSDETNVVNPLLFAVPLPVKTNTQKAASTFPIEHYFPTSDELEMNVVLTAAAKKHIYNSLGNLNDGKIKDTLRDIHLLMYLITKLDTKSFQLLCHALMVKTVDGTSPFPSSLRMVLGIVRDSFK